MSEDGPREERLKSGVKVGGLMERAQKKGLEREGLTSSGVARRRFVGNEWKG